ncbi:hypothetical protein DNTS_029451 [Danionella cerebrum]|uniref:V-SNARE coiled-coil homology domain-containing protein n=1 Tax=Danionella cerebrum TaxID=2873325 RepID=A0A553QE08_9TELE|nr:hypothetical protein DNTS_029451 [Danionella translucida]
MRAVSRSTMKLYSLSVLHKGSTKANLLKAAYDLSSFSFFQRSSVQEFMTFTKYLCHVYVRNDNLGGVVIADSEYPSRVCFTLLDKNPREADAMTKVQAELDETKIILHNTMESLLERGEKLDDLVQKSEHLGNQSKAFYKTARKQNSCCEIM